MSIISMATFNSKLLVSQRVLLTIYHWMMLPGFHQEGLAAIFGVPERYIDSITFKSLGEPGSDGNDGNGVTGHMETLDWLVELRMIDDD